MRCTSACQADVAPPGNPDGQIDIMDLLVIIERWGMVGDVADLDGDGVVNIGDLLAVMGAWGECPEP
ncbi:MAG: GC-type dockerin domain-anchored protein [Phycisphaerales bacterium]|nr:GC-type dockerin domain-anchored protein [Phycisphaerales bacterium]